MSRHEAVAQMRAVCAELADPHVQPPGSDYGVLLDTRHSTTVPTPADIISVLDEIGTHGAVPSDATTA